MINLKEKIQSLSFISEDIKSEIIQQLGSLSLNQQAKLSTLLDSYEKEENVFIGALSEDLKSIDRQNTNETIKEINDNTHATKKKIEEARIQEIKATLIS